MIQLSHIGEILIAALLNESQSVREVLQLPDPETAWCFEPEIRLNRCGSLIFDGAHKVDVSSLNIDKHECVAIEAKLGLDRLSKNEFSKRFLSKCGTSHLGKRVTGSMISVLERMLPDEIVDEHLTVQYQQKPYSLVTNWILIVRRQVHEGWKANGPPNLSVKCNVVVLEDMIDAYGSRHDFNELVSRILPADFYSAWFENA
jgi:hypothetical protein